MKTNKQMKTMTFLVLALLLIMPVSVMAVEAEISSGIGKVDLKATGEVKMADKAEVRAVGIDPYLNGKPEDMSDEEWERYNKGPTDQIKPTEYETKPIPMPNPINNGLAFSGKGFALNEDESEGFVVDLKTFWNTKYRERNPDESELTVEQRPIEGKISVGDKAYYLVGTVYPLEEGEATVKFRFSEVDPNSVPVSNEDPEVGIEDLRIDNAIMPIGSFLGEFNTFSAGRLRLLRGELIFKGEKYEMNVVIDANQKMIQTNPRDIALKDKKTTQVTRGEVVSIQNSASAQGEGSSQMSVKAVEVKTKRFLGIFPTGKKEVVLEIEKDGVVIEETVTQDSEETIQGYTFSVGSLNSEEEIDLAVQEA